MIEELPLESLASKDFPSAYSESVCVRVSACLKNIYGEGTSLRNATYFFEMSVLFETGELNTHVYDSGGLYRRKYA